MNVNHNKAPLSLSNGAKLAVSHPAVRVFDFDSSRMFRNTVVTSQMPVRMSDEAMIAAGKGRDHQSTRRNASD